ncbi:MAG TPA: hypothetical protein VMS86_01325 [Thermoanaerobaculia bacterium]|nr:hypothetical protein [Thermoanaerobaculia bacterium]
MVTVLAELAQLPEEIDVAAAEAAAAEVQAILGTVAQADLDVAMARLETAVARVQVARRPR